jgi:ribose 5-phosphate isomerase B
MRFLEAEGHSAKDFGSFSEESCDYPLFAARVARAVASGRFSRGVLACKTGVGMAIAANKVKGIRAAVVHDMKTAVSSRQHNDANIIVFGAMFIKPARAKAILKTWLAARSLGGRHRRRVRQMT